METQIHQNLAFVIDTQGRRNEAQAILATLIQDPFFTLSTQIFSDLGDWGAASGYEVHKIAQQPHPPPQSINNYAEPIRQARFTNGAR